MFILRVILLAVMIAACFAGFCMAQADAGIPEDLASRVSGKTTVTYLDLVRGVFPDARIDPSDTSYLKASSKVPIYRLFGEPLPEIFAPDMRGKILIEVTEKMETMDGREKILWLLMRVFEEAAGPPSNAGNCVLAAFRIDTNEARLIDAATVKTDDNTSFSNDLTAFKSPSKLTIAPGRQAVFIYNSTQLSIGGNTFSLVAIEKDKFTVLINEFYLLQDTRCGRFILEDARIAQLKTSTAGYRNIEVVVKTEIGDGDSDAQGAGTAKTEWMRHYRYVFAWQPGTARYKTIVNPDRVRLAARNRFNPCRYSA